MSTREERKKYQQWLTGKQGGTRQLLKEDKVQEIKEETRAQKSACLSRYEINQLLSQDKIGNIQHSNITGRNE